MQAAAVSLLGEYVGYSIYMLNVQKITADQNETLKCVCNAFDLFQLSIKAARLLGRLSA